MVNSQAYLNILLLSFDP